MQSLMVWVKTRGWNVWFLCFDLTRTFDAGSIPTF